MWLLNVTSLELENFPGLEERPPYGILSHTWGDEEVTYKDLMTRPRPKLRGWRKILGACAKATEVDAECRYMWIDTCCIDKSSSAELSESINSMFEWYQRAHFCLALLEDVHGIDLRKGSPHRDEFYRARWFSRGWTLQELIAPSNVIFCTSDWSIIGVKRGDRRDMNLAGLLTEITGIGLSVLQDRSMISGQSVARRMSWAANRRTTRVEDTAYCLLGIFGLNMPLLYGEGMNAFTRLQEEILRTSEDHSIFAWPLDFASSPRIPPKSLQYADTAVGCLSVSPRQFAGAHNVVSCPLEDTFHSVTGRGLRIDALLLNHDNGTWWILDCRYNNKPNTRLGVQIFADYGSTTAYYRDLGSLPRSFDLSILDTSGSRKEAKAKRRTIYIAGIKHNIRKLMVWECRLAPLPGNIKFERGVVWSGFHSLYEWDTVHQEVYIEHFAWRDPLYAQLCFSSTGDIPVPPFDVWARLSLNKSLIGFARSRMPGGSTATFEDARDELTWFANAQRDPTLVPSPPSDWLSSYNVPGYSRFECSVKIEPDRGSPVFLISIKQHSVAKS